MWCKRVKTKGLMCCKSGKCRICHTFACVANAAFTTFATHWTFRFTFTSYLRQPNLNKSICLSSGKTQTSRDERDLQCWLSKCHSHFSVMSVMFYLYNKWLSTSADNTPPLLILDITQNLIQQLHIITQYEECKWIWAVFLSALPRWPHVNCSVSFSPALQAVDLGSSPSPLCGARKYPYPPQERWYDFWLGSNQKTFRGRGTCTCIIILWTNPPWKKPPKGTIINWVQNWCKCLVPCMVALWLMIYWWLEEYYCFLPFPFRFLPVMVHS